MGGLKNSEQDQKKKGHFYLFSFGISSKTGSLREGVFQRRGTQQKNGYHLLPSPGKSYKGPYNKMLEFLISGFAL